MEQTTLPVRTLFISRISLPRFRPCMVTSVPPSNGLLVGENCLKSSKLIQFNENVIFFIHLPNLQDNVKGIKLRKIHLIITETQKVIQFR